MANILKPRRSSVTGAVPTTAQLQDNELAVNTTDQTVYMRVGAAVKAVANYFSGAWADITGKPTTVEGYGITNALSGEGPYGSTQKAELDTITKSGFYFSQDADGPLGGAWKWTIHHSYMNPLYGFQIANTNAAERYFVRNQTAGTWTPWRELWHQGNFDPATKAALAHAHDTADVTGLDDLIPRKRSAAMYMGRLKASMADGSTVVIACYGDSTTDGDSTTGWTANPTDANGQPSGTVAHVPPNAWPAKLQPILRAMHSNNSITVNNCGYSGKRMDDGWAYTNFDRAVVTHPAYAPPDACFIAFGLNDATAAGSAVDAHAAETRKLCVKLLDAGILPILLTCDAFYQTAAYSPVGRDQLEVVRQIDAVKHEVAEELGIPILDMGGAIKKWLSVNTDGYNWVAAQPDGVHLKDDGHAFKASFLAKELYADIMVVDRTTGRSPLPTWDSRSSYVGDYTTMYASNSKQGGSVYYPVGAPTNTTMMDMWVWNETGDTDVVYRGVSNELYTAGTLAGRPAVTVTEYVQDATVTNRIINCLFTSWAVVDYPYRVGKLAYGLSRVRYTSGDSSTLIYGNFEFMPSVTGTTDALQHTGTVFKRFPASASDACVLAPAAPDKSNEASPVSGKWTEYTVDAALPRGAGVILSYLPRLALPGQNVASILFRRFDDKVVILNVNVNDDGTAGTVAEVTGHSAALVWPADNRKTFRIAFALTSTPTQLVRVFEGPYATAPLLTVNAPVGGPHMLWGGRFGGLYYHSASAGAAAADAALYSLLYRIY